MSARADQVERLEQIEMPQPFRWLLIPAVASAVVAAANLLFRRRAPSLPRVSDEWLAEHGRSGERGQ